MFYTNLSKLKWYIKIKINQPLHMRDFSTVKSQFPHIKNFVENTDFSIEKVDRLEL